MEHTYDLYLMDFVPANVRSLMRRGCVAANGVE